MTNSCVVIPLLFCCLFWSVNRSEIATRRARRQKSENAGSLAKWRPMRSTKNYVYIFFINGNRFGILENENDSDLIRQFRIAARKASLLSLTWPMKSRLTAWNSIYMRSIGLFIYILCLLFFVNCSVQYIVSPFCVLFFKSYASNFVNIVLVGNKCDLAHQVVDGIKEKAKVLV